MFYSDDETKKREEFFQKQLQASRDYLEKNKERIDEQMVFINTVLMPILQKEHKTPEEIKLLLDTEEDIKKTQVELNNALELLGESLERQSVSFFNTIKQKALSGNEEAIKFYNELKPSYENLIESKISKN